MYSLRSATGLDIKVDTVLFYVVDKTKFKPIMKYFIEDWIVIKLVRV